MEFGLGIYSLQAEKIIRGIAGSAYNIKYFLKRNDSTGELIMLTSERCIDPKWFCLHGTLAGNLLDNLKRRSREKTINGKKYYVIKRCQFSKEFNEVPTLWTFSNNFSYFDSNDVNALIDYFRSGKKLSPELQGSPWTKKMIEKYQSIYKNVASIEAEYDKKIRKIRIDYETQKTKIRAEEVDTITNIVQNAKRNAHEYIGSVRKMCLAC